MFRFDPDNSYVMPAHFGPRQFEPGASGWYRDVTAMTVQYLTDRDRLAAYLPEPFEVGDEPIVTVVYARNRQVDWLAGRGYNMIGVSASAVYRGDSEQLPGTFALVIWENLTDPILIGRELQGIPKIYADIPDHTIDDDGVWHAGAAHFGHPIVDLSIAGLQQLDEGTIGAFQLEQAGHDHPMGWRHMTNVGRPGAAINEPTTFPSKNVIDQAWVGEGTVEWNRLTWEQNPTQYRIVDALAELPIVELRPAVVTTGSTNLVLLDELPRVLR